MGGEGKQAEGGGRKEESVVGGEIKKMAKSSRVREEVGPHHCPK